MKRRRRVHEGEQENGWQKKLNPPKRESNARTASGTSMLVGDSRLVFAAGERGLPKKTTTNNRTM
jgi:hypothetical protein